MLRALRRLLREEWGQAMRRGVFTGLAIAIAAGGMAIAYNANTGGTTTTTTTTTTPAAGTANIWMALNGGNTGTSTCSRSSTAITYAQAQAAYPANDYICGSVANSCAASTVVPTTVGVVDGSYGSQTTTCSRSDWITYQLSDGAVFSSAGGSGQHQKFIGGTISGFSVPSGAAYLWFEDTNTYINSGIYWSDVHDITWIGPGGMAPPSCPSQGGISWIFADQAATYNITIKYIDWHGMWYCTSSSEHLEAVRVQSCGGGGCSANGTVHDVIFDGDTFWNLWDDTSVIFMTCGVPCGTHSPYNIVIRNNFFGATAYGRQVRAQDPNVSLCDRYTMEYNTSAAGSQNLNTWSDACSESGLVLRGNVFCGTGFVNCAALPNKPDYHITSAATTAYGQGGSTCPPTDIDSQVRPQGTCDAGADEIAGP